jgi:hypothetical protein
LVATDEQQRRIIRGVMEIDKQQLIKLIEAFADTTHIFQCELALYQMIVQLLWREKGFPPDMVQDLVDKSRAKMWPEIHKKYQASHQSLLDKIPKLVDLLNSNQDEFLKFLREWKPQGPVN